MFIHSADTVNRNQLLCRCRCWSTKTFWLSNTSSDFGRSAHKLSWHSCLSSGLIHHANKVVSNRQPRFCEKAGRCFQKGPRSLFPGKSVILTTKQPPCTHNSLPRPAPLCALSQISTGRKPESAAFIYSRDWLHYEIKSTRTAHIDKTVWSCWWGVTGKGHRLGGQASPSLGTLSERIDSSASPNLEVSAFEAECFVPCGYCQRSHVLGASYSQFHGRIITARNLFSSRSEVPNLQAKDQSWAQGHLELDRRDRINNID